MKPALVLLIALGVGCATQKNEVDDDDTLSPAMLFSRMTRKITRARSIQTKVVIRTLQSNIPGQPDLTRDVEAELFCEGEKSRIRLSEIHNQGGSHDARLRHEIVTDGKRMRFLTLDLVGREEERWQSQKRTPPDWTSSLLKGLAHFDFEAGYSIIHPTKNYYATPGVRTEHYPTLMEFKKLGRATVDGEEAEKVQYLAVKLIDSTGVYSIATAQCVCTVWISVKRGLPIKREKRYSWKKTDTQTFTVTETFELFVLDQPHDPEVFTLPKQEAGGGDKSIAGFGDFDRTQAFKPALAKLALE